MRRSLGGTRKRAALAEIIEWSTYDHSLHHVLLARVHHEFITHKHNDLTRMLSKCGLCLNNSVPREGSGP